NQGDIVAEFEADKATVEVEAPAAGVISSLNAQVGDELKEGAVIGSIGAAGEAAAVSAATAAPQTAPAATNAAPAVATPAAAQAAAQSNGASTTPEGRIKASPVARNVAADRGVDLKQVQGSGPGGRIVKADIENFQPGAAPAAPQAATAATSAIPGFVARKLPEGGDVEIIDVSRMRARIATSTVESKQQIPHFYVTVDMNLEPLMALRKQINDSMGEGSVKISLNDMFVKATALTLIKFPNLNTHYYGDKLVRHKRINIGIAVALPQGGLINVVAKDADKLSLSTLAVSNKEMIARAQEGKVKPEDIQGSTFTVSNLGPKAPDVDHFIAIINPPEAGILAVGAGRKVAYVQPDGTIVAQTRIKITISVDHRVSDGAEGALYLQELKTLIENPMRLF
ncbi:MAG TPA: dihydrolipoamide acetyltransferase family protein, partial [Phototrophicaceae bacterium]|nr:dihydrolipoamide acetyltransferase family protein [Phototrophicaceae bacterium]